jgi:hypothetical protein
LRQLLENRISQLSTEVEGLFVEARDRGRREFADQLNQAVRRIRQSEDVEALGATLLDAAGSFSTGSALFQVDGQVAKGRRIRGVPEETAEAFKALEIPLASAAAMAGAVETRDPVVAMTTAGEVSTDLLELAGPAAEGRIFIFPMVVRDRVAALVYAWGAVQGSVMELLTQVAAGVWSELSRPAPVELARRFHSTRRCPTTSRFRMRRPRGIGSQAKISKSTSGRNASPAYKWRKCGCTRRKPCKRDALMRGSMRRSASRSIRPATSFAKRTSRPARAW